MMKSNDDKLNFLYEWAVWGHLESKKDIEMILLKGHLLLETALEVMLKRNSVIVNDNYSFFRKVDLFESQIEITKTNKSDLIFFLRKMNNLRNQLAHEFLIENFETDLKVLSDEILEKLSGTKYSNFTFRTKIVHSFSTLAKNILDIESSATN